MNEVPSPPQALACLLLPEEAGAQGILYMEFKEAKETVKSSNRWNDYEPYVEGQFLSVYERDGEPLPENLVLTYCGAISANTAMSRWWSRDGARPSCLSPIILLPEPPPEYIWQEGSIKNWFRREAFDFYMMISCPDPVIPFMMIDERNWGRAEGVLAEAREKTHSDGEIHEACEIYRMAQLLLGSYPDQIDGEKEY